MKGVDHFMIELNNISKTFKIAKRNAGMKAAAKALFSREYTEIKALDSVSFSIGDGETVGYIGPNGAGKSSTVKVMSGILTPDSGSCTIDGLTPWKDRRRHVQNIGVVFGQRSQLWWDVPVIDSFELLRDIYSVPEERYKKNLSEMCELLSLSEILKTPARQLSLGQRMRCEIAGALLHDPKILFLDEPTIGLDAVSKIAVRDFIKKLNREKNTTVILTTHDMQDIEALTDRILLIGRGKILLDGTLSELRAQASTIRKLTVTYSGGTVTPPAGAVIINDRGGHCTLSVDTGVISVSRVIQEIAKTSDIKDLALDSESTDELVVSLYREFAI